VVHNFLWIKVGDVTWLLGFGELFDCCNWWGSAVATTATILQQLLFRDNFWLVFVCFLVLF
jgi:hypothetical protein